MSVPTYLALGLPALAALLWAAYKLCYEKDKDEGQDKDQDDPQTEPRKLRTRPLKPAVDLSTYTYM